jgi:gas vesicle protein
MMNFLAGLGLGFGLGMLFAPMRGEDMREQLAVRASEMADTARIQYEQSRDKAERAISAIRGAVEQRTGTQV